MITPDKIYIPFYPNYDGIDTHLSDEWFEGKVIDHVEGWKEYIHKDTLIEWAKFVLKCQEEELAKYDGPSYMKASTMGRIDAYKVLIAKLNSL